ncbi:MAG: hypothetical protein BA861_09220 [Desulfobacterales bacterium S3730MH5]|nr:MAG: hypothetical protein BA861_09220 [Desulfobacterales bacterium S3730MH5]
MRTSVKAAILAGAFVVTTAFPVTALAGRGGRTGGQAIEGQTQTDQVTRGQRQRLRDGSCLNTAGTRSDAMKKKGKGYGRRGYGPGDGTGYAGSSPKDGTGHGAPSQK